jgi:hypothetical protein
LNEENSVELSIRDIPQGGNGHGAMPVEETVGGAPRFASPSQKPPASTPRVSKSARWVQGERGETAIAVSFAGEGELSTEQVLFALEYAVREIRRAHSRGVVATELKTYFRLLSGTPMPRKNR